MQQLTMGHWGKYEPQTEDRPSPDGDPPASGELLRDAGINRAVDHAEKVEEGWQEKALAFFHFWLVDVWGCSFKFAIEDVRDYGYRFGKIPEAPSARAWGGVAKEAAKRGWIRKVGYVQVKNAKAHCANANLWESCL